MARVAGLLRNPQTLSQPRRSGIKGKPRGYGYGHIGARADVRSYEDRYYFGTIQTPLGELTIAMVADGVGGSGFGERAAELAIQSVVYALQRTKRSNILQALGEAIGFANRRIYQESRRFRDTSRRSMETTLAVAVIHQGRLYIANVGDSRIYLLRGNELRQLTLDHVWAIERHRYDGLPLEEAWKHPNAHLVMRSLGREPKVAVDLGLYWNGLKDHGRRALQNQGLPLRDDDVLLVCSDGLIKNRPGTKTPLLHPEEIVEILHAGNAQQSAKMLVDIAVSRGADDNVTAVVVEMPGHKPRRTVWKQLSTRTIVLAVVTFLLGLFFLFNWVREDIESWAREELLPPPADTFRVVESEGGWRGIGPQERLQRGRLPRISEQAAGIDLYAEPNGGIQLQFRPDRYVEIGGDTQVLVGMDETWVYNGYALAQEFREKLQDPATFYQPFLLSRGGLIVSTGREPGVFSVFIEENGYRFDAVGTVMGVCFRENIGLRADCFEGTCRWSSPSGESGTIPEGRAWVWTTGATTWQEEPADFGLACYQVRGYLWKDKILSTPTPTPTATATPTATPTSTPTFTPLPVLSTRSLQRGNNQSGTEEEQGLTSTSTPALSSTPTPTPSAATPTPTPSAATPTPTPSAATPTPTPSAATPTPTPSAATPTPTPSAATPTPTPSAATPTPTPSVATPTPAPTPTPIPTPTPTPVPTPTPTPIPTSTPIRPISTQDANTFRWITDLVDRILMRQRGIYPNFISSQHQHTYNFPFDGGFPWAVELRPLFSFTWKSMSPNRP